MKLCSYGCGQEFNFTLKNGKLCCSKNWQSCLEVRRKNSDEQIKLGENHQSKKLGSKLKLSKTMKEYCKDSTVRERLRKTSKDSWKNLEIRERIIKSITKAWKNPELVEKQRNNSMKNWRNQEVREKIIKGIKRSLNTPKIKRQRSREMLDGKASWMNKFQKNPSKEELKLRKICQKILPYVEPNYPVYRVGKGKRSYNIDNAVPKLGLAIEYDGYFHFCDQEHIDYHNRRQQEIEQEGWKFLRYNIFQKFPTLEKVKEDIQKVLESEEIK